MTRVLHGLFALVLAAALTAAVALPAVADHCGVETPTAEPGGGVVGSPSSTSLGADHCPIPMPVSPEKGPVSGGAGAGVAAESGELSTTSTGACVSGGGRSGGGGDSVFGGVGDEDRAVDEESATAFAATAAGSATVAASGRCRTLADSGVLAAARIDAGAGAGGRGNDGSVVPTALVATALALITRGLVRRRRWRV